MFARIPGTAIAGIRLARLCDIKPQCGTMRARLAGVCHANIHAFSNLLGEPIPLPHLARRAISCATRVLPDA